MKRRLDANLANQSKSPGAAFGDEVRRINTSNHYSVPMRPDDVARLDAERMMSFYDARFHNAADHVLFVGAFTVDEVTPLLTAYPGRCRRRGRPRRSFGI